MSTRLSVGMYINQECVDAYLYEELEIRELFFQASAFLAVFEGCKSRKEYLERKYTLGELPGMRFYDEESVRAAFELSDYHLIADLDHMCIYRSWHVLDPDMLDRIHEAGEPYTWNQFCLYALSGSGFMSDPEKSYACVQKLRDHRWLDHMDVIAGYFRCELNERQCEEIRHLFLSDDRLFFRLPAAVRQALARMGRMHEDRVNRWYDA